VSSVTGSGPEGLPIVSRRTAQSTLRVRDGQTVALGGLRSSEESSAISRTPILSEIPLIGELFKRRTTQKSETELIILITPRIMAAETDEEQIGEELQPNTLREEERK
jgi:type II secretory pathway component GspD/PulD (secretin)